MNDLRRYLVDPTTGCWIWDGRVDRHGYGKYGRGSLAHRLFYEAFTGPIPDGLEIDHLCLNTLCVNPDHLEAVTKSENIRRRVALITHCLRGHSLTDESNVRRDGNRRGCRACQVIRAHTGYLRRRDAARFGEARR